MSKKKLHKMVVVTETLSITPRTIRYYDQMGFLTEVKRSEGGIRLFDDVDIRILKKVRQLQKEKNCSLHNINNKILGTQKRQQIVIVTDETATLTPPNNCHRLPVSIDIDGKTVSKKTSAKLNSSTKKPCLKGPSSTDFETLYSTLIKKGADCIISIHSSKLLDDVIQNAKKASKTQKTTPIKVIDSQAWGPSLGLLCHRIAEICKTPQTKEYIDIILDKYKQMPLDLLATSSWHYYLHNDKPSTTMPVHQKILDRLAHIRALFIGDTKEFKLYDVATDDLLDKILTFYDSELESRSNYMGAVKISYSHLYKEAKALQKALSEYHHKVPVQLEELDPILSTLYGKEVMMLSIL